MSSISAYCKARLLDGTMQPDFASLHTAFPGVTGASECSGGSYARQAIAFGAAAAGVRTQSGACSFNVLDETVRWVGYWQAGNWLYAAPAGGASPKNFIALPSSDTVYSPDHGWADTQKVALFNGTPPGGITEGAVVYVRDATTNTFKLALTSGGTAVNLTSAPSWGCVVAAITEYVYAGSGIFALESSTIVVPD